MNALSEEKYILAKQYIDLLEIVEEAFDYIRESFKNPSYSEGDRSFKRIAFPPIINTNFVLGENFSGTTCIIKSLRSLRAGRNHSAYSAWKLIVEQEMKPYIQV
ncbi:hypothetical protein [Mesobacillus jeotgali]|uniref:hypothetical protein n=1 Tax=Mesobacillus jeotgali TaxID=129985 RepID=UPI000C85479B|nr:hypothetical protein [Mesobacillus jeotgali]